MSTLTFPSSDGVRPAAPAARPHRHAVEFYLEDGYLLDSLHTFVRPALSESRAALVLATAAHREGLRGRLQATGFDVERAAAEGLYVEADAATLLSQIMVGDWPDAARFSAVVESLIARMPRTAGSSIAAFGELVALLCAERKADAALRIEQLWNEVAQRLDIDLLCAYPINLFCRPEDGDHFARICAEHSNVIPTESYSAIEDDEQRRRTVAQLQQANAAVRAAAERERLTRQAAMFGPWELDTESDTCVWSDQAAAMLGLRHTSGPLSEMLNRMYYSADREQFERALRKAVSKGRQFSAEFRVTTDGRRVRWLMARGRAFFNQARPLLLAVLIDISAGKASETAVGGSPVAKRLVS